MTAAAGRQGLELLTAAVLGLGLGVLYDLGRALRRVRPGWTVPLDLVFAVCWFLVLSLISIYAGGLRLFQCLGVCASAGAYFWAVSPHLVAGLLRVLHMLGMLRQVIVNKWYICVKKIRKNAKKVFPFGPKCCTIHAEFQRGPRR